MVVGAELTAPGLRRCSSATPTRTRRIDLGVVGADDRRAALQRGTRNSQGYQDVANGDLSMTTADCAIVPGNIIRPTFTTGYTPRRGDIILDVGRGRSVQAFDSSQPSRCSGEINTAAKSAAKRIEGGVPT